MAIGTSVYKNVNKTNKWSDELDSIYNQISNREKFKYDQNNDALYKQYAQQYQQNAKLAMEDTVGQVSALTGGYANSYAATAGQAMYNQQMSGLNDKALEIYQLALQQYNMEGDRLMGIYNMTASNYGLEQDRIDSEIEQAQWAADFAESQRQFNANMAYEKERAKAADEQWRAELASQDARYYAGLSAENARYYAGLSYDKQRDKASDAQYAEELAYKYAALEADRKYNDARLAEEKRQFDVKNGVGTSIASPQSIKNSGNGTNKNSSGGKNSSGTKPTSEEKIDKAKMKRIAQSMSYRTEDGWITALEQKQKNKEITEDEAEYLYKLHFGSK